MLHYRYIYILIILIYRGESVGDVTREKTSFGFKVDLRLVTDTKAEKNREDDHTNCEVSKEKTSINDLYKYNETLNYLHIILISCLLCICINYIFILT